MDESRRRPVRIGAPKATNAIDALRLLIGRGAVRVDNDGSFWRLFTIERWGNEVPIMPPRRIDYRQPNGYRYVGLCWQGAQFCGLAHRLFWLLKHGFIPEHKRISGGAAPFDGLALVDYGGPIAEREQRRRERWKDPIARKARKPRVAKAKPMSLAVWPFQVGNEVDPLIALLNGSVPKNLPPHVREEVCQELAVLYLEQGAFTATDVKGALKKARGFDPSAFSHGLSLDAVIPGTDGLRRLDLLESTA